jgi:outer membrane protein assembly factor BamB
VFYNLIMRLILSVWLIAGMTLAAEDWARFRGPNGSGDDPSTAIPPTEFGLAKNMAWKADVPFGRSSPVLFGNHLYITASEGDKLITLCYDAVDGKVLWRKEVSKVNKHEYFRANDPASPTPAADALGVYIFFADLGLISYTHDGQERWRHPLGPFDNFYGMASSPIVERDLVVLQCDHTGDSFLLAVDSNTGKQRWKTARPGAGMGWSSPIIYSPAGQPKQIITVGWTRVDSYYLATGEPRWWFSIGSEGAMGVPVAKGNSLIFYTSGHDTAVGDSFDKTLAKYDTDKDGRISKAEFQADKEWAEHFGWIDSDHDGFIDAKEWNTAIESTKGEYGIVKVTPGSSTGNLPQSAFGWRVKNKVPYIPSPLLYNGVYFMLKEGGIVTSLDPETGKVLKQGRSPQSLGDYLASPVGAGGKLYLVSAEGKVTVLSAQGEWAVLAVNDLKDEAFATPAISNGRIFVRTRSSLFCFRSSAR